MEEPNDGAPVGAEGPAQPLQHDRGEPADRNVFENPVPRDEEAHRGSSGDRCRLKAPLFTGNENVEQFIQEFSDVVAITQ